MDTLEGKIAVVTGAASGMGLAFAERFGRAGMRVVLADVEAPRLDDAARIVGDTGAETLAVVTDVSDAVAVERLRDDAVDRFGTVHVVCNNAGVAAGNDHLADWEWVMQVNFWGVVHGMRAFLPLLREQDEGHIVNTASMAGLLPGYSPYSASKWAVVGITEGLYHELRALGSRVGVSCLCPGWVATAIGESDRNRPEWARPPALDETPIDPRAELRQQFIAEAIASGMPAAEVAGLVHDAVLAGQFWIFTHREIVEAQRPRLDALLAGTNPPPNALFGQE